MKKSFGSTCHGAGRAQSRNAARKKLSPQQVLENLKTRGIAIKIASPNLITEEAPESYKVRLAFLIAGLFFSPSFWRKVLWARRGCWSILVAYLHWRTRVGSMLQGQFIYSKISVRLLLVYIMGNCHKIL